MNKKLLTVVGIGLLAATGSTYLFYTLISENLSAKGNPAETPLSVVVAARDLPVGTLLSSEDLRLEQWAEHDIPEGLFRDPHVLVDHVTRKKVRENEPLTESGVLARDSSWLAAAVPAGMRGVTVHVTEFAGVTQFIEVGDRVDVMVADGPRSGGNPNLKLKTVLENVQVIATGRELFLGKPNNIPTVTLAVEAKDAETLTAADHGGSIRLALRNPLDQDKAVTRGANANTRFEAQDREARGTAVSAAQRSPAPAQKANGIASKPPSYGKDRETPSPDLAVLRSK